MSNTLGTLIIQKEIDGYTIEFAYIWEESEGGRKGFRVGKVIWSIKSWM